jgi:hypothetical protein
MFGIRPVVRYLIVCDDVRVDPVNPRKVTIVGLISSIVSHDDPPFPVRHEELCVYAQLTELRGRGNAHVDVVHADSEIRVAATPIRVASFGNNPLEVVGVVMRVRGCLFPMPGLYHVRLWYNDSVIAEQPVLLR